MKIVLHLIIKIFMPIIKLLVFRKITLKMGIETLYTPIFNLDPFQFKTLHNKKMLYQ